MAPPAVTGSKHGSRNAMSNSPSTRGLKFLCLLKQCDKTRALTHAAARTKISRNALRNIAGTRFNKRQRVQILDLPSASARTVSRHPCTNTEQSKSKGSRRSSRELEKMTSASPRIARSCRILVFQPPSRRSRFESRVIEHLG